MGNNEKESRLSATEYDLSEESGVSGEMLVPIKNSSLGAIKKDEGFSLKLDLKYGDLTHSVSFFEEDSQKRKVVVFSELRKCYKLASWKSPDKEILKERVLEYSENLEIPTEYLKRCFSIARHEREVPTATMLSKVFRETFLKSIFLERKSVFDNLELLEKTIEAIKARLEHLVLTQKFGLDKINFLRPEFSKIVESEKYQDCLKLFKETLVPVCDWLKNQPPEELQFIFLESQGATKQKLATLIPRELLFKFSKLKEM